MRNLGFVLVLVTAASIGFYISSAGVRASESGWVPFDFVEACALAHVRQNGAPNSSKADKVVDGCRALRDEMATID